MDQAAFHVGYTKDLRRGLSKSLDVLVPVVVVGVKQGEELIPCFRLPHRLNGVRKITKAFENFHCSNELFLSKSIQDFSQCRI